MPSKFPKVFQKRKSSGDVLEEVRPVSSFRVLERPAEPPQAFEDKSPKGLRKPNDFRPASEGADAVVSGRAGFQNRGSAGTQRSGSSYGAYNTSSSDRYSSSSTLPSAASVEGDDFTHPHAHPRGSKTMPVNGGDSGSGFLKTAGRKFSFGGKRAMQAAETLRANEATAAAERPLYSGIHDLHMGNDLPAVPPIGRARATTETSYGSETTVTPGQSALDKLELNGNSEDDDGFGDIFAGIGEDKRKSQMLASSAHLGRPLTEKANTYKPYRPESAMPAPLKATRSFDNQPDVASATSTDGLMVASPVQEKNGVFEMGVSSPTHTRNAQGMTQHVPTPASPTSPTRQTRPRRQSRATSSKGLLPRRDSEMYEDTDALLVNESASRKTTPATERGPPSYHENSAKAVNPTVNPWAEDKPPPPPKHQQVPQQFVTPASPHDTDVDQALLNDESFQALAISADRLQQRAPSPPRVKPSGKVMTPAQFEKYRREQAQRRLADNDLSDSDDSKSENEEEDEEEDDHERHKRLAKQRQRQEAQMSVFRQSMMKTTGEAAMGPASLRPPNDRTTSRLSGKSSLSNLRLPPSPSEEDEDEDVPLGILAAHGFPSKEQNRPPNHERTSSGAGIQYSSETYPPPPASTAAGPAGPLPAFARKLPQDPFYGASLVNQSDRQQIALGGGDRGSVYGGSQAGGSHSSSHLPPPGGLVGVIASEERARAIRRGSPAKTFGFGAQDANGSMPLPPGVGGQPMMPMAPSMPSPQPNAEQQANAQMAQQMTQMMQMQMQWMQQMMAMQTQGMQMTPQMQQMQQMQQQMMGMGMNPGMQGMPGMQMPGQMPGQMSGQMPGQQQSGRASTMMVSPNMHPNLAPPSQQGRAMSMIGGPRAPSVMMGGMGPQQGYTPSIAPSERSNIGQPSRYRPVSTVPAEAGSRSRTQSFSSKSNFGGFGMGHNRTSTMAARPTTSGGLMDTGKAHVNVRLVETRADDEEDEAGWEEMRKKKENKKSMWRLRKSNVGLREKENVNPQPTQNSIGRTSSPRKDPEGLEGVFVPNVDSI